ARPPALRPGWGRGGAHLLQRGHRRPRLRRLHRRDARHHPRPVPLLPSSGGRAVLSGVTDVEVPVRGGVMRAALAAPDTTPAAGVVVIHEAFGLTADIRNI